MRYRRGPPRSVVLWSGFFLALRTHHFGPVCQQLVIFVTVAYSLVPNPSSSLVTGWRPDRKPRMTIKVEFSVVDHRAATGGKVMRCLRLRTAGDMTKENILGSGWSMGWPREP